MSMAEMRQANATGTINTSGTPVANDIAKFSDADTVIGRSYAEIKADLNLEIGTDILAEQAIGIADDYLLEVDGSPNNGEFARFTANGIEGRTAAEVNTELATGRITSTIASSATPTPAIASQRTHYTITALTEGATFGIPSGSPADGDTLRIRIKDDGSGETLAWNAIYRTLIGTLPVATTASKTSYIDLCYNSADTKWDCLAAGEEA
ncbi:hypothetical protein CMI37_05285 [Candidatus Pacearchaeota archaeon]|nr:hypothetical protein [Candidatus Pacearchaeota archaeon]|tara:strand:- start:121 stop:747 length:627 start_codon:yes stop_codon:yes gene_type:complete